MRRLLSFLCEGMALGASLDGEGGAIGLLIVTGGSQTRIGSHRLFERLAHAIAAQGWPCFRFDRRGVGDSEGEDPGWRDSLPDLQAAIETFRKEAGIERIIGFGLCDGASTLALHASRLRLQGLILVNPWFVEAEAGAPPPAAVKAHYRKQLTSLEGWKKLLSGSVSLPKLLRGIARIASSRAAALPETLARSLEGAGTPIELILARGDATAIGALAEWQKPGFAKVRKRPPAVIESDSHTFARPGDFDALLAACQTALVRLSGGG